MSEVVQGLIFVNFLRHLSYEVLITYYAEYTAVDRKHYYEHVAFDRLFKCSAPEAL